jgi:hypothetical protein
LGLNLNSRVKHRQQTLVVYEKIKSQVGFMLDKSYREIALLYAEDLPVFCRPRLQRFKREKNRQIADISSADSDGWFRLSTHHL